MQPDLGTLLAAGVYEGEVRLVGDQCGQPTAARLATGRLTLL